MSTTPSRFSRMLSTLSASFWILILGIVALFVFLVAMGAFNPGEVVGLTLAIVALTILWIAHAWWQSRHQEGRDIDSIRARERRGF